MMETLKHIALFIAYVLALIVFVPLGLAFLFVVGLALIPIAIVLWVLGKT